MQSFCFWEIGADVHLFTASVNPCYFDYVCTLIGSHTGIILQHQTTPIQCFFFAFHGMEYTKH